MSDALPLPPRPNLGQYKKLAKDLQGACNSSTNRKRSGVITTSFKASFSIRPEFTYGKPYRSPVSSGAKRVPPRKVGQIE
jgi:hypothetical protein